jgi:hypothetical protein
MFKSSFLIHITSIYELRFLYLNSLQGILEYFVRNVELFVMAIGAYAESPLMIDISKNGGNVESNQIYHTLQIQHLPAAS